MCSFIHSPATPFKLLYKSPNMRQCRGSKLQSSQSKWEMSEAGLRPKKSAAYYLWQVRRHASKVVAASVTSIAAWKFIKEVAHDDEKDLENVKPIEITLVSFAVTRKAYETITAQFAYLYQKYTGVPVKFRLSFGGSGTQARAIVDGLPGDIVALALPLDIMKIEEAGLISPGWQNRAPHNAVVAKSVVALVTRRGNPKKIRDWDDLTRSDVNVLTANPKTAGVARWNFLALWGHKMKEGEKEALKFVTDVFHQVPIQPRDAREASDVFYNQKQGDVLLNYENEVIMTNNSYVESDLSEQVLPYVVPSTNVQIETPIAIVDKNIMRRPEPERSRTKHCVESFVKYLYTPSAQKEFAACGFRVHDQNLNKHLPKTGKLWTVENELQDWLHVQKYFFSSMGILDKIQAAVGEARLLKHHSRSQAKSDA